MTTPAAVSSPSLDSGQSEPTPGPWRCEGPDCFGDYNILPPDDTTGALAGVVNNGRPAAEVYANARLIAAAPDLLKALEECLREHGGFTIKGACERRARAAIAKSRA